MKVEV
jgi:hypothetical protein